jgi:O-6-methylguanine DNA methyltransferase
MDRRSSLVEARALAKELTLATSVETPTTLVPNVLLRVGLADIYWPVDTAIGPVFIAASDRGISGVARGVDEAGFEQVHLNRTGRAARRVEQAPDTTMRDITAVLNGDRKRTPSFDLRGLTAFEEAVLRKALEIPRGEVRPYSWVAREIGHPGAARAVGTALANNPVPLLIPCHRVVRGDGVIGNYLFGTEVKHALLEYEHAEPAKLDELARRGVRYFGSDTTRIFCFPTCRHARRTTGQHLVSFGSEAEARSAGYRPCKVCRPAAA